MMPHILDANNHGNDLQTVAKLIDPDTLADTARQYPNTFAALASIAARAYWQQINGAWVKK